MGKTVVQIIFWIGAGCALAFTAYMAWLTISIGGFMEFVGAAWLACFAVSAIALEHAVRTDIYRRRLALLALMMATAFLQFVVIVWTAR